jgi:hypothetical protein
MPTLFVSFYAPAQETNNTGKLPVKRVVLYKNAAGHFDVKLT